MSRVLTGGAMKDLPESPLAVFHEGERALQERAGVGGRMADVGPRVIRDFMLPKPDVK